MPAADAAGALARHAVALATVRDFARRAEARRVVVLVDLGAGDEAAMIEWLPGAPLSLTEGAATWTVPDDAAAAVPPLALAPVRPVPASAIRADAATGEIEAPLGTLDHLAHAVVALARALGGRSVATAEFATADADRPLTIAGRPGDATVVAIGDAQYELRHPAG